MNITATQVPHPSIALPQVELDVRCDRHFQSFVSHQYAAYPFRLSRSFRLEAEHPGRLYLYLMNASPGLFAHDALEIRVCLQEQTQLYLTDQAAMKVHSMPLEGTFAQMAHHIHVGAGSHLEYVPEPIILYPDAEFHQRSHVTLDPTAHLFWSEIILPGRLARQEWYDFRLYRNRLQVYDLSDRLLFTDAMVLTGQENPFKHQPLFAALPAIANIIAILPDTDLAQLTTWLSSTDFAPQQSLQAGHSPLPNCNGVLIRAIADRASTLRAYIRMVLNYIRQLTHQSPLPEVPK
ncbi:MAG: urease accessory protein UreD [Synechococcales bacterium]|nr:urease accessory protein UreD [Synechococcales bacterium]